MVQLLLSKGASLTVADNDGNTALVLAAERGHLDLVKLLLQRGGMQWSVQQLKDAASKAANSEEFVVWAVLSQQVRMRDAGAFEDCLEGVGLENGVKAAFDAWQGDVQAVNEKLAAAVKERQEAEQLGVAMMQQQQGQQQGQGQQQLLAESSQGQQKRQGEKDGEQPDQGCSKRRRAK